MTEIALLLLAAAGAHAVSRATGLPTIPLLVVAGAIVSGVAPLPDAVLQETLVLGLTFLLFITGLELDPDRVGRERAAAVRVGILQFLVMAGFGFAAAFSLGFDLHQASYLALALTASSTLVVVRLLQRRQQMFEPVGRMVLGVLLLQDLLVIALIPVLVFLPLGVAAAARGFGGVVAIIFLAWATRRWLSPRLPALEDDEETLLLVVLGLLFVFLATARAMGLPLVVGAFLAGVALSAFPVNGIVRGQLESIGDFFSAIFFTALGGLLLLPARLELLQAGALVLLVVLVTPLLVTAVAERSGLSARPGIESGLLLAQTSELSLVVGLQGLVLGQIDASLFTVIVLVTVTTMVLTPFITADRVVWVLMALHPLRGRGARFEPPSGHILLLGTGETGMPLLETLVTAGHDVFVVDDDPARIWRLNGADIPCLRGDASDETVLARAGVDRARLILSTIRRPEDNRTLLRMAAGRPTLIRVFDPADGVWIRQLGGHPVLYAEAAATEFLAWFTARAAAASTAALEPAGSGSQPTPSAGESYRPPAAEDDRSGLP
jgi:Kef-type K+ transport system membrane component KefB